MKKVKWLTLLSVILVFILLLLFGYVFVIRPMVQKKNYVELNENYYYEDRTEECAEALEEIYRDEEYIYYLPCIQAESIFIIDKKTNEEYTLRYSIINDLITIDDVVTTDLGIIKEELYIDMVEILANYIRLREDHGTEYDQIDSIYVNAPEKYEILDTYEGETYTWYKISYEGTLGWFADNGEWAREYKEEK